jgi:hypothetical protein
MADNIIVDGIEVNKQDFDRVNNTGLLQDAGESAFFVRELEHIKAKSYDTKQKALKATMLIPVSTEADPGAETITYRRYTQLGTAAIVSDYAQNSPRVDIYGQEFTSKVYTISDSFGYSRQEIRRSRMTGRSLDAKRAKAAKRAYDEKIESITWDGDTAHNLSGFINYPGITAYTVPNGAGGLKTFVSKTPDEIIKDIKGLMLAITDTTNGVEQPDTLLLPYAQYMDLATRRVTDGDSKTVLTYIMDNFPMLKNVEWLTQLKEAGAGSTDRMMMYSKDPDTLTLELPMPYTQLPPQIHGLEFEIMTEGRCGGIIVYYPLAISYGDGI